MCRARASIGATTPRAMRPARIARRRCKATPISPCSRLQHRAASCSETSRRAMMHRGSRQGHGGEQAHARASACRCMCKCTPVCVSRMERVAADKLARTHLTDHSRTTPDSRTRIGIQEAAISTRASTSHSLFGSVLLDIQRLKSHIGTMGSGNSNCAIEPW
jgi:hypothetical protein